MINGSYDASKYDNERIREEILRLSKSVEFDKSILEECIKLLNCNNSMILDFGCGPGATTSLIFETSDAIKVCGVDREERFVLHAKETYKESAISFCVADGEKLPFSDNSFDMCFSRYVFQHLKHPEKVLQEIIRVTRTGGFIGVYDWDESSAEFTTYPQYYMEYLAAEKVRRRFTAGDINMGRKLSGLFVDNGLINVKDYLIKKDTVNPGRDALWSGQKWMDEINENHPYIKMGLMKLEHLQKYYESLKEVILSKDNYVCYTDVFTIGEVKK